MIQNRIILKEEKEIKNLLLDIRDIPATRFVIGLVKMEINILLTPMDLAPESGLS